MGVEILFHGHACFELSDGSARVLIDPFLAPDNPAATTTPDDVDPTDILLTHGHADHLGSAVEIAKRTGASCVAITDLARWLGEQGIDDATGPNLGGTVTTDWGWVKLVLAMHTNSTPDGTVISEAAGLIVRIGDATVYHLGDTCLFGDLRLIGERDRADVALMPIGGHYTMDRRDAVVACEMLGAGTVIPCHYDTFPVIETDAAAFKAEAESACSSSVVVLRPGERHEV
jgi:L-ascorbate metabolism protein UlaG (beta-lactamase superfamily)